MFSPCHIVLFQKVLTLAGIVGVGATILLTGFANVETPP